ncbi:MAG: DNA-protecting protein DprA [Candidatus Omnitrophica bacterium]|nr:DNA-protecting protein DprA [Candidatus Omnitrophota bacterium]
MNEKDFLIALNIVSGLGSVKITALLSHFGKPSRIFQASIQELMGCADIGNILAGRIKSVVSSGAFEKELKLINSLGVKIVTLNDPEYPGMLRQIYDPPVVLYARGNIDFLNKISVAIVGCRRASLYGLRQAEQIASSLSMKGVCVVSGLARGIDTAAHKGALNACGSTVAVLGSGLGCVYPEENINLSRKIIENGVLISEFPLLMPPLKGNFPRRNRIISGLCRAVVVIEAARRSGSLITANFALSQNRDVFALPGTVGSVNSQGTNNLIKQGAKLIESAEDILEELSFPEYNIQNRESYATLENSCQLSDFDEKTKHVLELLDNEPQHIDVLVKNSKESFSNIYKILLELQIKGLIRELEGKRFAKKEG